jgi:hypothetical protein
MFPVVCLENRQEFASRGVDEKPVGHQVVKLPPAGGTREVFELQDDALQDITCRILRGLSSMDMDIESLVRRDPDKQTMVQSMLNPSPTEDGRVGSSNQCTSLTSTGLRTETSGRDDCSPSGKAALPLGSRIAHAGALIGSPFVDPNGIRDRHPTAGALVAQRHYARKQPGAFVRHAVTLALSTHTASGLQLRPQEPCPSPRPRLGRGNVWSGIGTGHRLRAV